MTNLPHDIGKSLEDFEKEWKKLAKEIRSSLEWKEMSVYSQNNKSPPNSTENNSIQSADSRGITRCANWDS